MAYYHVESRYFILITLDNLYTVFSGILSKMQFVKGTLNSKLGLFSAARMLAHQQRIETMYWPGMNLFLFKSDLKA